MKRFKETVNIQPKSFESGYAQSHLTLADKLGDFKNQKISGLQEKAVSRGVSRASQTEFKKVGGVTQQPDYQQAGMFGFIGSIERQAHNKALRSAYIASIDTDNIENIGRIAEDNKSNSIAFNDAAEGYKEGVLKGIDPSLRQQMEIDLDRKIVVAGSQVYKNQRNVESKKADAELKYSFDSMISAASRTMGMGIDRVAKETSSRAFLVLQERVNAGFIDKDDAAKMWGESERLINGAGYKRELNNVINAKGLEAGVEWLDKKSQKPGYGFDAKQWGSMISSLRTEYRWKKTTQKGEKAEDERKQANYIYGMAKDGKDVSVEIKSSNLDFRVKDFLNKVQTAETKEYQDLLKAEYEIKTEIGKKLQIQDEDALIADINGKLGTFTPDEMRAKFTRTTDNPTGLRPQVVEGLIKENEDVINDPRNYRRRAGYSEGSSRLQKDITQGLWNNGTESEDIFDNTNRGLKAIEEYNERVKEGDKPSDAYKEVVKEAYEEKGKGWLDKLKDWAKKDTIKEVKTDMKLVEKLKLKYPNRTEEEIIKALNK